MSSGQCDEKDESDCCQGLVLAIGQSIGNLIIFTLVVCCVVVPVLICLTIAKIVIGAIYLYDCSIEDKVPIFLIVGALTPMFLGGIWKRIGKENEKVGAWTICSITGFLFHIAWLIAGSVWVYGTWSRVKSDTYVPCSQSNVTVPVCTEETCNDVLLTFAFVMCTIDWILTGVWIVFIGCIIMSVMRACFSK